MSKNGPNILTMFFLVDRVSPKIYNEISQFQLQHGRVTYNETAQIVSMIPAGLEEGNDPFIGPQKRIVVATAGTTDLPVAEEAAVVLEAAQCKVDRICDVGVAGLHRILNALPRLQDPDVGCIIVCAGMDGALPSVVGGLVSCPVIAVPTRCVRDVLIGLSFSVIILLWTIATTHLCYLVFDVTMASIGYGVSLGGVSAMLTMLNSCAPGVAVMNIDNGFGAAAFAYKCVRLM
jgi:hypothetical protein